jgi:hypothetical protein
MPQQALKELPKGFQELLVISEKQAETIFDILPKKTSQKLESPDKIFKNFKKSKNTFILFMPDKQLIDQWPPCFYAQSV